MSMLEHALAYAKRGFPVFPCNRKKEPITQNGVLDATTSTKRIEEWWTRHPNANIGLDLAGAGLMAVDFDPGSDFAEASRALGGLPKTGLIQRTPRGGKHHLYELAQGEAVANSTSKVSPKVDIRGLNGYILLAPSRTEDGEYSWEAQGKPAFRTDEMVEKCNLAREKSKDRDEWIIEPDLPENIKAAERWLKHEAKIAVEGQGGDGMAYATAAHLKSFGISEELAFDLMLEHWNPRCDPPWSGGEVDHLQTKVANAYDYNTSPPGNITKAYKLAKDREKFRPVEKPLPTGREVHAGRFRFVDREGAEHIRPPKWLIPNFIPQGGYCVMFGAPGTFKSFLALDIAMSVACGPVDDPIDELWPDVAGKFPVLYCLGEGRPEFSKRIRAWEKHYLDGAKAKNLILSDPVPLVSEELEPFIDGALQMSPEGYGLVVIDTAGRAMQGLNENSQEHASKLTAMVQTLQRDLDCAVLVLHHSGHGEGARAKGSMEFYGAPDTVVGVGREGKEMVVTLYMQKQKDAAEWVAPRAIKLLPVADSLVPTDTDERPAAPAAKGEPPGPSKAVVVGVIDKLLGEILSENRLKPWSTKALAEAIAMADKIEVSSKTLQNSVLRDLREIKGTIASKCYDPKTQRWKWRE